MPAVTLGQAPDKERLLLRQSNSSFNAQEISNILWAFGKAHEIIKVDGRLLDALAKTASLSVHDFTPQGLSNVA
jgi:hypothetical protein